MFLMSPNTVLLAPELGALDAVVVVWVVTEPAPEPGPVPVVVGRGGAVPDTGVGPDPEVTGAGGTPEDAVVEPGPLVKGAEVVPVDTVLVIASFLVIPGLLASCPVWSLELSEGTPK